MSGTDETPDNYPEHIDLARRVIVYCRMNRECYARSPFLDHRIVRSGEERREQGFGELPADDRMPAPGPVHFIFHNAFCCSTLLTRYLEEVPGVLALREPHSLFELATCRRFAGTTLMPAVPEPLQRRLLRYLVYLLARRYRQSDAVIIKPSDGCNNLARDLLQANPQNRAILLFCDAGRFVASVLRIGQRTEWARVRARELSMDKQRRQGCIEINPAGLDRGKTAALVWALQMEHFRDLLQRPVNAVPLCIDSEALVSDPQPVLAGIAGHLGLSLAGGELAAIVGKQKFGRNAKAQGEQYDMDARNRDFRAARSQFASEIDGALDWLAGHYGAAFVSDPLHAG